MFSHFDHRITLTRKKKKRRATLHSYRSRVCVSLSTNLLEKPVFRIALLNVCAFLSFSLRNNSAVSYFPSASCTTSTQCSQICYWGYSTCYQVNTQVCCGSLTCAWYSGEQVYNKAGICVCSCGSTSQRLTEQGRANSSSCSTTTCQNACQALYPTTCGSNINNAYCSDASGIGIYFPLLFISLVFYLAR